MLSNHLIFDIETGPLPEDELFPKFNPSFDVSGEILKKEPTPHRGLKDPEKVSANLLEVESKRKEWSMECEMNIQEQRDAWIQQGALRAERGKLIAFGFQADEVVQLLHEADYVDEKYLLETVIDVIHDYKTCVFAGFNILNFDLPFIRRRCIVNGIKFPFYDRKDKWKPWTIQTYDAMVDWGCGVYGDRIKLDDLARGLGCGAKNGDGAQFHELYKTDRAAALDYLRNDIKISVAVIERILGQ